MGDSVAVAHQKGRRDLPLGGALIVHPSYLHTLAIPPVSLRPELCWADLPPEVVRLVLLNVDCHRALCNFAAVSRECRDIASDDLLWRPLCLRRFNCPDFVEPESWRELFRFNKQVFKELFLRGYSEQVGGLGGPIELPAAALAF